jgi:voltage-gated potassium channel
MNPLLEFWQRLFRAEEDARAPAPARLRVAPASPADATSTIFLVLRRMRAPLFALIVIYAISVLGLTLIPGQDAEGKPWRMDFFHAFYFMSYTATTIGFGEIPHAFTDAQRLWVTFMIYLTVIGWAWAIGTLLALTRDRGFQDALTQRRFARRVRALAEPFVLIAGYGAAGRRLAHALDALGRRFVVLDIARERIDDLALESFRSDVPGLAADAGSPPTLLLAGLANDRCEAVIALTDNDETNLAVTMAVELLRPGLLVIARTVSPPIAERMRVLGAAEVVNPFDLFGDYLRIALRAPASFRLIEWLTSTPGSTLPRRREPPRGRWIVCGFGRFGSEVTRDLRAEGLEVTVVEPGRLASDDPSIIVGHGVEPDVLAHADPATAVGLIAATDNDTTNLSVIAAARRVNPALYLIGRQNHAENASLFKAVGVDFALIPAQVTAHEVLARIVSPLLYRFLGAVSALHEEQSAALVARLADHCGERVPALWVIRLRAGAAPALARWIASGRSLALADLLRDPEDRSRPVAAVPLMLVRDGTAPMVAPDGDTLLAAGDEILFAGRVAAHRALDSICHSDATRDYVLLGRDVPSGWVWRQSAGLPGN